ncbi:MAG TPA: hypothetical protein DCX14_15905 [Flavobacteriales bacterium]|nr:DUF4296 domain-containing protein [Flavobacteriales bacterium]HAW21667.1 hypothetical protein [Flavobacteriales bacterium]
MKWLALIPVLILAACSSSEERIRPDYVIPEDSMVVLIAELQILNAEGQHREVRRKKWTDFVKVKQRAMYDSLGYDEARIDSSMNYYLDDYEAFQKLHEDAMDLLSERLAKYKAAKKTEELEISKPAE